jgi:hypothetical protein
MSKFNKSLIDRLSDSATAKRAMLRKVQARPGPDDPVVIARKAERKAIVEAREARMAAKAAAAEKARVEQATREAAARREEQERIERQAALEEEKRRARDERYAVRKAAKKG